MIITCRPDDHLIVTCACKQFFKMPETRHYCPHCEERVSLSTFHRHKQLYYDEKHKVWSRNANVEVVSSDESCGEQDEGDNFPDEPFADIEGIYCYLFCRYRLL